ncbi:SCP-like protein [Ancylostoma ceylanicum]|nr:SCP-like protein [Ancylostoma ceylanicum]
MTNELRRRFLRLHNGYRSILALGHVNISEESNETFLYAHRASRMRILDYDCDAEGSAYESAIKQCSSNKSSSAEYDENVYVIDNTYEDEVDPALKAISSWTSQAFNLTHAEEGIPYQWNDSVSDFANVCDMFPFHKFAENFFSKSASHETTISQCIIKVAWDAREKLGCAVVTCDQGNTTHVVCHYGPKAANKTEPIYKVGVPCSNCTEYTRGDEEKVFCHADEGVCVINLRDLNSHLNTSLRYPPI